MNTIHLFIVVASYGSGDLFVTNYLPILSLLENKCICVLNVELPEIFKGMSLLSPLGQKQHMVLFKYHSVELCGESDLKPLYDQENQLVKARTPEDHFEVLLYNWCQVIDINSSPTKTSIALTCLVTES